MGGWRCRLSSASCRSSRLSTVERCPPFPVLIAAHVVKSVVLLTLTTVPVAIGRGRRRRAGMGDGAAMAGQTRPASHVAKLLMVSSALYTVFAAYPFALGRRARDSRDPYLAAMLASAMAFFGARTAFVAGDLAVDDRRHSGRRGRCAGSALALAARPRARGSARSRPVGAGRRCRAGICHRRDSAAAPAAVDHDRLGARRRGAGVGCSRGSLTAGCCTRAWLCSARSSSGWRSIPKCSSTSRAGRCASSTGISTLISSAPPRCSLAARFLSKTTDSVAGIRVSSVLPGAAVVLLFLLLNIEIADFYATGPTIMFRFGVTVAQDLTYTIGWLIFGMGLLAAGIVFSNRPARAAAVTLIAVTTFKCFLYDLGSLEGLARIGSFVGLAMSLALVSLALQKFVLGPGARCEIARGSRPIASGRARRDCRRWCRPRDPPIDFNTSGRSSRRGRSSPTGRRRSAPCRRRAVQGQRQR